MRSPTLAGILTGVIVCSALMEIVAEATGTRRAVYVLKPLTTGLIVLLAATLPQPVSTFYRAGVVLGLLFSLAGDVFLMLPTDRFVAGMASFLLTHVCYITAFSSVGRPLSSVAGVLLAAWGTILVIVLWPHVGKLRVPVLLYAAALLTMAWKATAAGAALGAVLFVASDSTLVRERFVRRHRWGHGFVLSTYFAAQLLIALSVRAR